MQKKKKIKDVLVDTVKIVFSGLCGWFPKPTHLKTGLCGDYSKKKAQNKNPKDAQP